MQTRRRRPHLTESLIINSCGMISGQEGWLVCSSCGFENQTGMRFCGMCGTPLPHKPLTAPGAQSTLNFTRVPFEVHAPQQEQSATTSSSSSSSTGAVVAESSTTTATTVSTPLEEPSPAASPELNEVPASTAEVPKELVPDVPFDEYLQSFRYQPPKDPTEITMRGDAPIAEHASTTETATVAPTAAEPSAPKNGSSEVAAEAIHASQIAVAVPPDTGERLGLEPLDPEAPEIPEAPETPLDTRAERPRFLDLGEPPKETNNPAAGTSTIVGPSFLGLSDTPEIAGASAVSEVEEPARSHWRAWLAVAVLLIFAALGVLEWRSQASQSNNGPVEMIKMKVRNWTKGALSATSSEPAPASSAADTNQPEIQVQPQNQPAANNAPLANGVPTTPANGEPPNAANNTQANAGAAGATIPAPTPNPPAENAAANSQPPGSDQSTAAVQSGNVAANAPTVTGQAAKPAKAPAEIAKSTPPAKQPAASVPKPKTLKAADHENNPAPAKTPAPGAEELAKAKNASDSAAEAAWLWKATAKGNPDAPVQLADMYIKGDGVPRSCEQAMVLLKTAAAKENASARNRLASLYATGQCVLRNRVEAYRWLSSALVANPNSEWAQQNRDFLWQQMTPEERQLAQKYR